MKIVLDYDPVSGQISYVTPNTNPPVHTAVATWMGLDMFELVKHEATDGKKADAVKLVGLGISAPDLLKLKAMDII